MTGIGYLITNIRATDNCSLNYDEDIISSPFPSSIPDLEQGDIFHMTSIEEAFSLAFRELSGLFNDLKSSSAVKSCGHDEEDSPCECVEDTIDGIRVCSEGLCASLSRECRDMKSQADRLFREIAEDQALLLQSTILELNQSLTTLLFNPTTPVEVTDVIMNQVLGLTRGIPEKMKTGTIRISTTAKQRATLIIEQLVSQFRIRAEKLILLSLDSVCAYLNHSSQEVTKSWVLNMIGKLTHLRNEVKRVFSDLESALDPSAVEGHDVTV